MVGTDELLTEILKSRYSSRSSSRTSSSAASTSAPAGSLVANWRRWSGSEPELAPIRIGIPAPRAAATTCSTLSSPPMLPGLIRTAATPAATARSASDALKWMSAITGSGDPATMAGRASASARPGTATRTISQPASASRPIWPRVASTSAVSVVVIDCTETGAPAPIATPPTVIRTLLGIAWRISKRPAPAPHPGSDRAGPLVRRAGDRVQVVLQPDHEHEQDQHDPDRRDPLERRPRQRPAAAQPLDRDHQDVPSVQRQERQQVDDRHRQRDVGKQAEVVRRPVRRRHGGVADDADGAV